MTNKNSWASSTVGKFFEVTNGKTNTDDAVENGEYPLFDRSIEIKYSDKFLFDTEAIIIPGEGKDFIPRYYRGKFDLHQRAYAIFPKDRKDLSLKFLYYWMFYKRQYLSKMAVGSTVKSLRLYMLQNFPLEFPEYKIQEKITNFLELIDQELTKTDQIIQKTEVLKQGLMQTIFSKKNTSKWESVFLPKISRNLDNKRIPITKTVRMDGKYPYYGATGIVDYVSDFIFDGNYLLISEDGANLKDRNYPIAFSIIGKNWVNNHAHVLEFSDSILQEFVKHYFNFINLEKYLTGMAQPKLNQEKLNQIPIPKPKDSKLQQYVSLLNTLDHKRQTELARKEKLLELKRGFMQDIFSQRVQIN